MASWAEVVDAVEDMRGAVRHARRRDGLSLREVAQKTRVPFNSISRFERGDDIVLTHAVALMRWLANQPPPGTKRRTRKPTAGATAKATPQATPQATLDAAAGAG